jgi:ornithine cyclodeaminase/alanine dehydrogenase-like protein (mu-crystallin family)
VICTLTSSPTPILAGQWVADGVHVNLVGSSSRSCAETDDDLVTRARFFVDFKQAALNQAGELLGAIERGRVTAQHITAEIGEVIAGTRPGRTSPSDLTVFKSSGIAAEDIALAAHIHRKAEQLGLGRMVEL